MLFEDDDTISFTISHRGFRPRHRRKSTRISKLVVTGAVLLVVTSSMITVQLGIV